MGEPRFVDGIGPPLSQVLEDYAGERTTPARDVVALVLEVERLDARVRELQEALRLAADTIERLAEQQAMPDDWYDAPLNLIRRAALVPANEETADA